MTAVVNPTIPFPAQAPALPALTLEEFERVYLGRHVEVIDGQVREIAMPSFRHGKICSIASYFLMDHALKADSGHVMSNDPFVRISDSPLKILAPDVCYCSYERLPRGPVPEGVLPVIPDLVVEVRSPSNTWSEIFGKIGDYLRVGIRAVVVLDADSTTASVYRPEQVQQILTAEQELTVPEVLPGFAVRVGRLFDA